MPAFTAPFLRLRLTPAIGILPFASFTIQKWLLSHTALSPLYSSPRTWRHLFLNGLRTKQSFSYLGCLETPMSDSRSWEAQIKVPGGSLRTKETISWSAGDVIPGEGYSQKNWVGCAARFPNLLPIYGQNLRHSLPYSWLDQKFETLFMTRPFQQNPVSDLRYNYFPSSDQC